jgi:hypothetical protein
MSLSRHEEEHGGGYAIGDNVGFIVDLPNRRSFSPDAAWFVGDVDLMEFLVGAPRFAVEVRREGDYGARPSAPLPARSGTILLLEHWLYGMSIC